MTEDQEEEAKDAFVESKIEELLDLDESYGEEDARREALEDWAKMTVKEKEEWL